MTKPPKDPDELAKRRAQKEKGKKRPTPEELKAKKDHLTLLITHGSRMRRGAKPRVTVDIKGGGVEIKGASSPVASNENKKK